MHSKIKNVAPKEHEIAKLKNKGKKLLNIFVEKDVIAAVGIKKAKNV